MWHCSALMTMGYPLNPTVTLDFSGERCARSVQGLSSMTRGQLEAFLQETALASASVILVRPRRPKPEKIRRDRRRHQWR